MKVDFKQAWSSLLRTMDADKPQLLTGIGTSLLIVAVPLAVAATVQACKKVEEKKKEIESEIIHEVVEKSQDYDTPVNIEPVELKTKEVIKISWKYYIPAALAVGIGSFCTIASTKEGLKRTAAMAAAYQLTDSAFTEYRKAAKDVVGEKKESEIEKKIMKDRMEMVRDEDGHIVSIYDTRDGTQLCFDYWSGRYFYSDVEYIKSQINRVNEAMLHDSMAFDGFASLNDIYRAIGLPETGAAEDLIWRLRDEGLIELKSSTYITVDDRPCWLMTFTKPPRHCPSWMMDRM